MLTLVRQTLAILCLLIFCSSLSLAKEMYDVSKLTPTESFEYGELLRTQLKNNEALKYLKFSADSGHASGSYVYAMELRRVSNIHRHDNSYRDYFRLAAENGSLAAMHYLYAISDWLSPAEKNKFREKYYDHLIELGAVNPSKAYFRLSQYYMSDNKALSDYYLAQAQRFGLAQAYMERGLRIERGDEEFLFQAKKERVLMSQYDQAAKLGYIPAIRRLISIYEARKNFRKALAWREKALEQRDLITLLSLSKIYRGISKQYNFIDADLAKSKAYLETFLETAGSDALPTLYSQAQRGYLELSKIISEEQRMAAESIKRQLMSGPDFYNYDEIMDNIKN
ncbi:hypothetical protein [Vibrio sp. TBV020]|uniref:hypothetical protein n=1 Tax=Vibrio sp. TBV020 TaxID=3137398 RepID=UPI0038CDAFFA